MEEVPRESVPNGTHGQQSVQSLMLKFGGSRQQIANRVSTCYDRYSDSDPGDLQGIDSLPEDGDAAGGILLGYVR